MYIKKYKYTFLFLTIVSIYLFFLFSNFILGSIKLSTLNFSEIGTNYEVLENGNITLENWIYDKEKKMMEIEISCDYESYLDENMLVQAKSESKFLSKQNPLQIEIYIDKPNYKIFRILNVPNNFRQIAFGISYNNDLQNRELDKNDLSLILYSNYKEVKSGVIKNLKYEDYLIAKIDRDIIKKNEEIKEINKNIDILNNEINDLENINAELNKDLEFQVGEEKENTINSILNNNQEILNNNDIINENKIKIEQIEAEIEEQRNQQANYKNN
ncbi:hypothetical protein [Anaerofustis butyriciformans]|uniref:hypothetical protein n=1 Tax=Anaerofustis butyriciformans TaxID=3108533 RepID=UPI002E3764F3|nr:hypothetical protein [Anaerofustis sp. HA2171]